MDQVTQIREKIDIVALLQEYISLKKAGRNFKALCPFHTDKTPSLVVSPERQIWHCFGCGKGGDCFSFLMEYEHVEFPEALRMLADKAGVVLQNQHIDTKTLSKKETIYAINRLAAEFYHYLLTKHAQGKEALSYVKGRGVLPQTIDTYMVGFSPYGRSLVTYLSKKKKYSMDDIFDAGLASRRGRDVVDFFQGRLMFPLYDHRGNIIGFSGRVLNSTEKTSKYINTRETLVYHKGLTFFGLNMAKESIRKQETALLLEGEFDVISCFQEGITNTVAVKGTALTSEQVNLLSRFCKKVQVCFDADSAGQEALKRSLPLLERKGLLSTVVVIPNGKDADESIKNDAVAFKKAVQHDVGSYDYLLEKAKEKYGATTPLGKKQIGDELLPMLADIDNEIVKEHYLQLLGKTINTSYDAILKAIDKLQREKVVRQLPQPIVPAGSREEKLEHYLVALIVQSPFAPMLLGGLEEFLGSYEWHIPSLGKVLAHVEAYLKAHLQHLPKDALPGMPQELMQSFDTCFLLPLSTFTDEASWNKEVQQTARDLEEIVVRQKMKELSEEIAQKEKMGEQEAVASLQQEFARLAAKRKK